MYEARLHIRGIAAEADGGAVFRRTSPLDGSEVTEAPACGPRDAVEAANAAAGAFPLWRDLPADDKRAVLARARALLLERTEEFVEVAGRELGATPDWIRFNLQIAAEVCDAAQDLPEKIAARRVESRRGGIASTLLRRPAGVVLAIAPWNAAITLAVRAIVWPLICGNTVVFKGSELCPKLHSMVVDTFCDAGLPEGALCSVIHGPEMAEPVVEALVSHPAVRRVNFTGSTRIGRRLAEIAAPHLKPCLLELSDKAPLIVLEDADVEAAAMAATYGAFFNQGQICMATERVIAVGAVAEPLSARMTELAAELGARRGDRALGPLISEAAGRRVGRLIEDALSRGAELRAGGTVSGSYVQPTLLDRVTSAMQIYGEESFGPVAAIIRALDEEEAVTISNDTEFGLVASVYSGDASRALALADRLETGTVHVNGPTVYDDPEMPFGGVKASGYGRFGGEAAIDEFTEQRWITVQDAKRDFPFWA